VQVELQVMNHIAELVERLDDPARSRVLAWAISALDVRDLPRSGGERGARGSNRSLKFRAAEDQRLSPAVEEWLRDEQDYCF
jgi:hypothetical protein